MTFHSCPNCNFILQPGVKSGNLVMTCRNCNYHAKGKDPLVYTKNYKLSITESESVTNPWLIYDVTLARTNKKKCKNPACDSHKDTSLREAVIFNKPSEKSLINYFRCVLCSYEWTTS